MTTRVFLLAVLFGGIALVAAPAQPPTAPKSTSAPKVEAPADPMAEEIEIMRRLLDRTLEKQQHAQTVSTPAVITNFPPNTPWQYGTYYPPTTNPNTSNLIPYLGPDSQGRLLQPYQSLGTTYNPYQSLGTTYNLAQWTGNVSAPHAPPELRAAQGVYLKGYGVVYTATVALPTAPPVAEAKKSEPKPLTDWERTRQELHGEKAESAKTPRQDTLADAVLKVLAKNGQHFSQLAETEQITVVLTLPRTQSCTTCHVDPSQKNEKGSGATSSGSTGGSKSTGSASRPMGGSDPFQDTKVNNLKKDAQKATLLGDLHMKQNKNEQAIASFEEALKLYLDASETLRRLGLDVKGTPETDGQLEQDLVVTATKLLQLYTVQGKKDEVQKMLRTLELHVPKAKTETPNKPADAPAKVELPAKLVISAPKKRLDLVGSDKITFEEFRKNATVEYQPARTIEKQPAKP